MIKFTQQKFTGLLVVLAMVVMAAPAVYAAPAGPGEAGGGGIAWGMMLMQLFGGLALFLFGMEQMADGLKSAAGNKMKQILARFTKNRVKAAMTGAATTAVIQSSSVTTVLVVGFVSAGLMTLTQSVGVIMGANVGTTLTAQIVAFKVGKVALLLVAVGFFMLFVGKKDRMKQIGGIVMGLGLIFFGMEIMSDGMKPLRSYQPFIDFMAGMERPLLGILTGAIFTALVQSSSATTGLVIALATQGLLGLPAGIALIFGSNIGTCVTAWLASLGKSREALRVAYVHVIFNVLGVVLWFALIPYLAEMVRALSPVASGLEGGEKLAAEVPRQIANAHALFNIANTVIMLPFAGLLGAFVMRIVPDRPE
jgi:phosphate:Na+ symporter